MNESNNESENKPTLTAEEVFQVLDESLIRQTKVEKRVIALERALEALLKKEEMSKLNLSGGDGEWY
jgi:ribosomal silencing factor RsfS